MLYTTASLAAVLSGLVAMVAAGPDPGNLGKCVFTDYSAGIEWEDSAAAIQHARNACLGYDGKRGYYQDVYYKPWNQSPYSNKLCVTTGKNHINFEIANLNPNTGFTLNNNDCFKEFKGIIENALSGGEYQCNAWWFRIDPNSGPC